MAKLQDELGDMTVTGTAGGGAVTVTANGHQKMLSVAHRARGPRGGRRAARRHGPRRRQRRARQGARDWRRQHMGQLTAGLGLPPGLI